MQVHEKLDEITKVIENARSMPMSASCILNRAELLAMLDQLRKLLPQELHHAELLLQDRGAVVDEGRRAAQDIVADAMVERERLISGTDVMSDAVEQAEQVQAAAAEEAARIREEVDDYVDSRLANFEVVLNKTLAAVHRGREKLRGRHELEDIGGAPIDDTPLP